jgi:hypothetical protein
MAESDMGQPIKKIANDVAQFNKNLLKTLQSEDKILDIIVLVIIFTLILSIGIWISGKLALKQQNCTNLKKLYGEKPNKYLENVSTNSQFGYNLRDYFIKTAYNCCCGGNFKNDFVSICALTEVIKQGARCLDFEIYSVGGEPVVAASSVMDRTVKETYNSLPFSQVLETIANQAFSSSFVSNNQDPLILHFRIKSIQPETYKKMATAIYNNLESQNRLLGKDYSYEFRAPDGTSQNLGAEPLSNFLGKIIISVDISNYVGDTSKPLVETTPLNEYINIGSNSVFMRLYRDNQIVYTHDPDELIIYNKKNMSIVLPDLGPNDNNENALLCMSGYGCQMAAMSFQNFDANMEVYDGFFDQAGTAFVLKPVNLRFVPSYITIGKPPPTNQCAGARTTPAPGGFTFKT